MMVARLTGRNSSRRHSVPLRRAAATACLLALSRQQSSVAVVHGFSWSVPRSLDPSRLSRTVSIPRGGDATNDAIFRAAGANDGPALDRSGGRFVRRIFRTMTSASARTADVAGASTATAAERDDASGSKMSPQHKLDALRTRMEDLGLDVYLVPSDDPHLSEYVPDAYMRRKFLSGFGGSAGTAVVTKDSAFLWTDSRYWNEASMQLDPSCWELQKAGIPSTPTIPKFLTDMAVEHRKNESSDSPAPLVVGLDGYVHPASFVKELNKAFEDAAKTEFDDEDLQIGRVETVAENLVDIIWGADRPEVPYNPFRPHPIEYAGWSVDTKIAKIRKEMEQKKATMAVFCTLDDVAYLLNVRAMGDVDTCPVGIAYATVTDKQVTLYCDPRKVQSDEMKEHLKDVTVKDYDVIVEDIAAHCSDSSKNKVWLDTSRANFAISNVISVKALVDSQNAVTPMKACKNRAELEGMRKAHIVDGAAMAKFMADMVDRINNKGQAISEVDIDLVLTGYRAEQPGFLECSFPTIAGVGSNAAIIHYRAEENELMKYLDDKTPILIDSGGQYTYGTTDVTRTWHFGEATDEFKDAYTRVLKGNIGVDTMIFPENSPGFVLDVFARKSLWEVGKDYGHGTGHGVGAALNVHEGPMSISPRFANQEGLKKGMVISNEPGYYVDGKFGIRIENLLEIRYVDEELNEAAEKDPSDDSGDGEEAENLGSAEKKFMKFEKLTMIPIQKSLINIDLMTPQELDWLDAYHEQVFAKVSPLLEPESAAMKWLEQSCEKIKRS